MLSCYHPLTGPGLIAVLAVLPAALLIGALLAGRQAPGRDRLHRLALYGGGSLGLVALASLLVLWLGSYAHSPLSFAHEPALQAFLVQKQGREPFEVAPGGGFSISASSTASISAVTQPAASHCYWMSAARAALDIGNSCDIAYTPPQAELDVLRVSVHPTCGMPLSAGQIKIAVLP